MTTAYNPHRLQPGVYQLFNYVSNTVLDVAGSESNFKYIIGNPAHDGQGQKWEFAPLGQGYSIRSMHSGHYLTIEDGIHNGTRIIASPYPVSWALEATDFERGIWWIGWPNSLYLFDLDCHGGNKPGTAVQLWTRNTFETASNRLWRFVKCEVETTLISKRTLVPMVKSPVTSTAADTEINTERLKIGDSGDSESTFTTIITTTTTTVTKVARVNCVD